MHKSKSRPRLLLVGVDKTIRDVLKVGEVSATLSYPDWESAESATAVIGSFQPEAIVCVAQVGRLRGDKSVGDLRTRVETIGAPTAISLSDRRVQILFGLRGGLQNKEIARQLGLSVRTGKYHLSALFELFDVTNRTELLGSAVAHGVFLV